MALPPDPRFVAVLPLMSPQVPKTRRTPDRLAAPDATVQNFATRRWAPRNRRDGTRRLTASGMAALP